MTENERRIATYLEICLVLDELFRSSVKQSDVGIRTKNFFSVKFKNETQHTVSSRMLRTLSTKARVSDPDQLQNQPDSLTKLTV